MANDKQSLTNYETILWLWDATDEQRIKFLASLDPRQRAQFCDVLRDVLNNPWEGEPRSAIKLTKLNKLLGQNVDRIKKQVQFSGDKTPELTEAQIFRLFHDYTVLNHDGTRKLSDLGRESLLQLLKIVDGEFQTFYGRDQKNPLLMWNGFLNDSQFPNDGMEKSQVEPSDYGELNDKITNYYYPIGGKPLPHQDEQGDESSRDEEDYHNPTPHDENTSLSAFGLTLKYLPVFLAYACVAIGAGVTGLNGPWVIVFALVSLFVSVKWYHVFKFQDRAWAALLQGFWVLYFTVGVVFALASPFAMYVHLAWPLLAFPLLVCTVQPDKAQAKKFAIGGTTLLGVLLAVAVFCGQIGNGHSRTYSPSAVERNEMMQSQALVPDENHYRKIKSEMGGLCWRNLRPCDLSFLTADDMKVLRLQFSSVLTRHVQGVLVEELTNLAPVSKIGALQEWKANVRFNCPIYSVCNAYSKMAQTLDLIVDSVKYYSLDYEEGKTVPIRFTITESNYDLTIRSPFDGQSGVDVYFAPRFEDVVSGGRTLLIAKGSELDQTLAVLNGVVSQWRAEMAEDKLIMAADEDAAKRHRKNDENLKRCQRELIRMARMCKPHSEATEKLRALSAKDFLRVANIEAEQVLSATSTGSQGKRVSARTTTVSPRVGRTYDHPTTVSPRVGRTYDRPATTFQRQEAVCSACRGSGQIKGRTRCSTCKGSRVIDDPVSQTLAAAANVANIVTGQRRRTVVNKVKCPACDGKGSVETVSPCGRCGGRGKRQ